MSMPQTIDLAPSSRPVCTKCAPDEFEARLESVLEVGYRTAYHLSRNVSDAQDLVQDAALLACRHRASFQAGTNFKAWFLRILTNVFYSKCRKCSTSREAMSLDDTPEPRLYALAGEAGLARGPDPARAVTDRLDAEAISSALAALPLEYRVVTTMHLVDDLAYQDIASALDIPIGTVRSRLHRGRALLKAALWETAVERGLLVSQQRH